MIAEIAAISGAGSSTSVIFWSCVLVVIVVVGFGVAVQVKRRMRDEPDAEPAPAAGFTLSDLRRLHRSGEISDEEFEKAKLKIVESAKTVAEREVPRPRETGRRPE